MNEQRTTAQRQGTPSNTAQGITMFKDRIAAMKSGPWQLGGTKNKGQNEEDRGQDA